MGKGMGTSFQYLMGKGTGMGMIIGYDYWEWVWAWVSLPLSSIVPLPPNRQPDSFLLGVDCDSLVFDEHVFAHLLFKLSV